MPDGKPDFEKPDSFFALHLAMANCGAVLFTVSARPAFSDGTVEDWAEFLAGAAKMQIIGHKPTTLAA